MRIANCVVVAVLVLAGFAALAVDLPVARFCLARKGGAAAKLHLPGDVRAALDVTEVFAHGFGVALICLAVYVLDRRGRRRVLRIVVCAFGSGLAADLLKLLVISRTRPRSLAAGFDFGGSVLATFGDWAPVFRAESLQAAFDSARQAFPSAHAATAVGLAVALAWRYPQGRWLFLLLAALSSCQRIASGFHYVSDTFWGAAVGVLVAAIIIQSRRPGGWFDRFEQAADLRR